MPQPSTLCKSLLTTGSIAALALVATLVGCDNFEFKVGGAGVEAAKKLESRLDESSSSFSPRDERRSDRRKAAAEAGLKVTVADADEFRRILSDQAGNVVLVDYWATWCGPCQEQFPHTVAKAKELSDRNFSAISVSFDDPEDLEPIVEFLREQQAESITNLVSAHGPSPESNEAFRVQGGIPWYQLYDGAGELRYVFCDAPESGVEALPVAEIDAKIAELMYGSEE